MSNRSAARGTAAGSPMRLTLRTSNADATSNASPSRCFLFCNGSRAARSARTAAATVSTPPIPKAPPNQRWSPPITSSFQGARILMGGEGVRRLCVRQGARLHRPPALPPSRLDQKPRSPARGACAGGGRVTTKPRLALDMVERAIAAGVPFAWVAADTVYGTGEVEMGLRRSGKGYVLGASATQPFNAWIGKPEVAGTAEAIARGLEPSAWIRLSAGEGTKGARLYDWAYLELADLVADEFNPTLTGTWTRGLLIRRSLTDGELAYFSTWCPAGTPIQTLVSVEGRRWAIEDAFETAKTELGLAHNETRSWHGWHRHVSLVMLAFAMMAAVRHHANQLPPPKTKTRARRPVL